jgi:hypothetical protein
MSYGKKLVLVVSCFLFVKMAHSQETSQNYFFQDVGWAITLPYDFTLLNLSDYSMNIQEERDEVDGVAEVGAEILQTQTMIIAMKDRLNYFNIVITPYHPEEEGSWEKNMQSAKSEFYKTMTKSIGRVQQIDTAATIEYIDGLVFNKFQISAVTSKGDLLDIVLLSKFYNGYDFTIVYFNADGEAREQIELMLKSSRFH